MSGESHASDGRSRFATCQAREQVLVDDGGEHGDRRRNRESWRSCSSRLSSHRDDLLQGQIAVGMAEDVALADLSSLCCGDVCGSDVSDVDDVETCGAEVRRHRSIGRVANEAACGSWFAVERADRSRWEHAYGGQGLRAYELVDELLAEDFGLLVWTRRLFDRRPLGLVRWTMRILWRSDRGDRRRMHNPRDLRVKRGEHERTSALDVGAIGVSAGASAEVVASSDVEERVDSGKRSSQRIGIGQIAGGGLNGEPKEVAGIAPIADEGSDFVAVVESCSDDVSADESIGSGDERASHDGPWSVGDFDFGGRQRGDDDRQRVFELADGRLTLQAEVDQLSQQTWPSDRTDRDVERRGSAAPFDHFVGDVVIERVHNDSQGEEWDASIGADLRPFGIFHLDDLRASLRGLNLFLASEENLRCGNAGHGIPGDVGIVEQSDGLLAKLEVGLEGRTVGLSDDGRG